MPSERIKDIPIEATILGADDYFAIDRANVTAKISGLTLAQQITKVISQSGTPNSFIIIDPTQASGFSFTDTLDGGEF